MTSPQAGEQAISDARVRERTGKSWKQWFTLLDRFGGKTEPHREIAKYVREKHDVSAWWAQAITVRYEQERGLRVVGEKAGGTFEVSVQRSIAAPARSIFDAFTQPKHLNKWFAKGSRVNLKVGGRYSNPGGDQGVYLSVEPPKKLRYTWDHPKYFPGSTVEVTFSPVPSGKTAVRIQHLRLPSERGREMMKSGWTWTLTSLKSYCETGVPVDYDEWVKSQKKRK